MTALVTPEVYAEAICRVLHREFGTQRFADKIVAGLARVTPRTARNWFDGLCAPQGAALLNLMAQCEAVDQEMARLKQMARGGPA